MTMMRQERLGIISSQAFSVVNFRGPLIADLVKAGVTVYALAPDYTDELKDRVRGLGAEPVDYSLSRAGRNPFSDVYGLFTLVIGLRRLKLDTVLTYTIKPVIYGSIAAAIARIPFRHAMIEGLGYAFTDPPGATGRSRVVSHWIATYMYRISLLLNRRVFFENHDDVRLFRRLRIVRPPQIVVLDGVGVALEAYPVKQNFSPPTTFILVGRMLRSKGVYDFVDAARIVRARYPATRFILVGGVDVHPDSVARSELQGWVDEGIVEWTGHVANVSAWLAQASVFVLPSYGEGKPRSTQEAMACGLPVITTDTNGCRETVEEGVNGWLVPVHDPEALARAMIRFVENPGLVVEFGRMSRHIAERRFDIYEINKQIVRALGYDRRSDSLGASRPARPHMGKQVFDRAMALTALPVFLAVGLIVAIAVRLTSAGPVVYWSERVGAHGKVFMMPKFRTMRAGTPAVATHLLENSDIYLTPVGRLLRKASLDEVPQIWSILIGDMSFVGPRPALPSQSDLLELRAQCAADALKPGLTGWAQVNGRDSIAVGEKARLDCEYVRRQSLRFDLYILFRSVATVARREGISH